MLPTDLELRMKIDLDNKHRVVHWVCLYHIYIFISHFIIYHSGRKGFLIINILPLSAPMDFDIQTPPMKGDAESVS